MSRSRKITLLVVGGFFGLLVLAVGMLFLLDVNAYKPRLERVASEALGMEVHVGGRLGISFFPGLHVTLADVHIRNRGADVVFAKEANLGIDVLPLLYQEIRIGRIALKRPRITIERGLNGKFNFEKPEEAKGRFPTLNLTKVSVSDGTLLYVNKKSGEAVEAGGCHLDASRFRLAGGEGQDLLKNISLTAQLVCGVIRAQDLTVSDVKFSAAAEDGSFELKPITMRIFGGQGSGNIRADFSGAVPLYHVRYSLTKFRIEEFLKTLSPDKVAEGSVDFSTSLSMRGKTVSEMKQTAHGDVSLRGKNLTLNGRDLDQELSRFESSQNFNLVDVGAFFFAGPAGLAVTKGYSFASIFQGSGGSSTIRTLVSDWKIGRGVAQAKDVAMATDENRIALKGRLDFVNAQFDDVTMALIDANGCAKVRQKIRGSFRKPVVEKPNVLKALAGPALRLLKKTRDLLPGGQCEVFYAGSVAPPN